MAAVKSGMGREQAHKVIKRHATASLQEGKPETFIDRLAEDTDFPLDRRTITELASSPNHGDAIEQAAYVFNMVAAKVLNMYPHAATYKPEPIR